MFTQLRFNLFLRGKYFFITTFSLIFIFIWIISSPTDISAHGNDSVNRVNDTAAVSTKLKITPTSIITAKTQEFTREIIIENVSELAGAEIHLSFNPEILEVLSLNDGQLIADSNKIIIKNYNNSLGQINYTMAIFSSPISGSGILFSIRFKVKEKGTSTISFDFDSANNRKTMLLNDNNQPILFNIEEASVYVPTSIAISPQDKTISAGNKQEYKAFAICNGTEIGDITNLTTFTLGNGAVFTGNILEAKYMGTWVVIGKFFDLIGTTSVIIVPGTPTTLNYVSGNNQTSSCQQILSEPFVVKVTDVYNNPVSNIRIDFSVISHPTDALGFDLSGTTSLTSIDGLASTILTFGSEPPGTYTIEARNDTLSNSPIIFDAYAYRRFGSISGRCLLDFGISKEKKAGILVTLIDGNTVTTTNTDSYFCFSNLPVGVYSISFMEYGATPFTKTGIAITKTQFNDTTDIGTITLILGDASDDGQINILEWPYIITSFGSTKTSTNYNPNCDFNCDGMVNVGDLMVFKKNFGKQIERSSIQMTKETLSGIAISQNHQEKVFITFSPQTIENALVGEIISVDILISGGKDVLCGEIHLTYDEELLEPKGVITQGNWPTQGNIFINQVQNGKIDYAFGIMEPEENNSGVLGTIKFVIKKNASGKVLVDFDDEVNRKTIFVHQKGTQTTITPIEASAFTLIAPVTSKNLENVYCYPNPASKENKKVTFKGISGNKDVVLKIYTITGELVYEGIKRTNSDGKIEYELKNKDDKDLASGIYIWFLDDGRSKKKGKFGVIK